MPWKLVSFLTTLVLAAFFIGFNLENRCDVSLVFYVFKDVPIFVSLLFAFVAGSLAVIPFIVGSKLRSRHRDRLDRRDPKDRPASTVVPNVED
jgi:uncharacterized integral membrane protein